MWTGSQVYLGHWERRWFRPAPADLTLLVIRNNYLFPWTNTDTRHMSANWVLAPQQSILAQGLAVIILFHQISRRKMESPKTMHKLRKQRHRRCRWQEYLLSSNSRALSLRAGESANLSLGHQTILLVRERLCLTNIHHLIIFKWGVYSASVGMSRSPHDSSTTNCFPSGHGNLT